MSQALSSCSSSLLSPSSRRPSKASQPVCSQPLFLMRSVSSRNRHSKAVKAASANGRDNLDHLQRTPTKQYQVSPPKRRVAPVAPVCLWDRFPTARTVQQMMETMEQMMEDPFTYSGGWPSPMPAETGGFSRGRTPWEIKEGEHEYKMRFDMPGMTKEDVKVWVEEKMLVIKAENKVKNGEGDGLNGGVDEDEGVWSAKSYGKYSSRIALPEKVQFEKIHAEVKDGVLYITIPKDDHTRKTLDINVQ